MKLFPFWVLLLTIEITTVLGGHSDNSGGLSSDAKVGIGVGVGCGIVVIVGFIFGVTGCGEYHCCRHHSEDE